MDNSRNKKMFLAENILTPVEGFSSFVRCLLVHSEIMIDALAL